jgi:hypothetical protein
MASYNKFNAMVGSMANGVFNFSTDSLKIMLVNSPAPTATNSLYGDLTEIAAGGGYSTGGIALTSVTDTDSSGTVTLAAANATLTATGTTSSFRYAVLYDATPTSPLKPLVGWWDYGSSINLVNANDTFTINLSGNIFTLS